MRALIAVGDRYAVLLQEQVEPNPDEADRTIGAPIRAVLTRGIDTGRLRDDLPPELLFELFGGLIATAVKISGRPPARPRRNRRRHHRALPRRRAPAPIGETLVNRQLARLAGVSRSGACPHSNRRPPPYHALVAAAGRNPRLACLCRFCGDANLQAVATGCNHGLHKGSIPCKPFRQHAPGGKRRSALGKATTDRCSTPPAVHQRDLHRHAALASRR